MDFFTRSSTQFVIAGLGIGLYPSLGSLTAAYVLILAVAGPMVARLMKEQPGPDVTVERQQSS
jgi:hypothetical protein